MHDSNIPHGWLVIDKPLHRSSNSVLSEVKRLLRPYFGKVKMGFSGTLDPLASGVLPIALGEALKTMHFMTFSKKAYTFQICFGAQTTTDDAEGEVVYTSAYIPTQQEVVHILPQFLGPIRQTPPVFSALKINGVRAYQRARAGEDVSVASRTVHIDAIACSAVDDAHHMSFHVSCGAGTYVRSLARDIGKACQSVGHVSMLRRTYTGAFSLDHAITLEKFADYVHNGRTHEVMYPCGTGLDDILAVTITKDQYKHLMQGQPVKYSADAFDPTACVSGKLPLALWYEDGVTRVFSGFAYYKDNTLHPTRMLHI